MDASLSHHVDRLLRRVAGEHLLPRLGAAATEKSPGELVTAADLAAEAALTAGLSALLPEAAVIGEEAASRDPGVLAGLGEHALAWVVDPLDGTRHFAAGTGPFGVMVGLMARGVTQAAWILLPQTDRLAVAWRGHGATLDGRPVRVPAVSPPLVGALLTRFFPPDLKARAEALPLTRTDGRSQCAAQRYVDLLTGAEHFAAYWRTLPWDHAPGGLLVEEAGGVIRRMDGSGYRPADGRTGLLVAADAPTWSMLQAGILALSGGD